MIKQRFELTEDEHIKLRDIGDEFWLEFSKLCDKHIARMPAELHDLTEMYLGEKTSIYGRKCK